MKKILLFASALAGLFLAGSCQRENLEPMESANTVTYTVTVPDALATKGIGDDISAVNQLVYEVYRTQEEGVETFTNLDNFLYHKTAPITNGVATIELEFVNNQNFTVLFWAHTKDNGVYDVDDLTSVTIESPDAANNINAQAFVGRDFVRNCVSDADGKVTLTRPVSQLNIATTPESLGKFQDVIELKGSSVKVTGLATSYNIGTLSAFGATATEYEYTETAVPEEALTVNGVGYTYVAMNYVGFAANDGSSDVTVSYVINTSEGDIENEIINVPFKPNFRTNIIGNLITSKTAYTIELDETWGNPDLAPDAIYMAAALGGEVTLDEDIVLTEPLEVKAKMTINLNGKTISGNYHKSAGAIIKNNGTLTITGGTISSSGENGGSAVQNNGTMTIEDVTLNGAPNANGSWPSYTVNNTGELTIIDSKITSYHGAVASYGEGAVVTLNDSEIDMAGIPGFTSHGIYTYDNGKVIVDGGTYANRATDQAASGASVINGAVEVKAGNFSGRIENYYGTPVLKGGSFSVKPNNNFIAAGYKAVSINGKFHVLPEVVADAATAANVTAVTESTADVATALTTNNGEATMFMWNDVAYIAKYGEVVITSSADDATTARGVVEYAAGLKTATVAEGIEVVGNRTFRQCKGLETVSLPSSLTEIGPAVFQSCSKLANVTIPASVTTIGEGAFAECTSLTSINIPDGITRLEKDVLRNTGLVSIEIPASVNYIGTYAFRDCESLTEVKILSPEFTIENNTFTNMAAPVPTMTIYVVNAEMKAYLESVLTNYDKSYITVVAPEVCTEIIENKQGELYEGDFFENPINDALYFKNYIFTGDAAIKVVDKTYGAIILENCKADINGDLITIDNDNNSVMILQDLDLTLAEGKKLIKSVRNTIYQVFMANITINGVKMTNENIGQYLENVGWFQVVDEI